MIDVAEVLHGLAAKRKVFHSEADFQFALAWEAKERNSDLEVRLETHPEPSVRLDLELFSRSTELGVAIELKYMTRLWAGSVGGENFALKNHGASDLRGYDVIKDIGRVERFVADRPGWSGFVIVLTNDGTYWRPRTPGRPTNADAFRLGEGTVLSGSRAWGSETGGTSKGREPALELRGWYALRWHDFSLLDHTPAGKFRSLTIQI